MRFLLVAILLLFIPRVGMATETASENPTYQQVQPTEPQLTRPATPERVRRGGVDVTVVATRNVLLDRREGSFGLRGQRTFYAPRLWRFVVGLRPSLQFGMSPSLTFYPQLNIDGTLRFLIFSFVSLEYTYGPRIGLQFGRHGFAAVAGQGSSAAWLFHPWRDNRQRFRFGVEFYTLQHIGGEEVRFFRTNRYRNFAGYIGFEQAF